MSKLATFRLDEEVWEAFLMATKEENASASSVLLEFVKWYVAGNRLQKPDLPYSGNIEQIIDERIALLQTKIEDRITGVEQRLGELAA
ncbi:MAG: hypothetical protein PUP93_27935 [Rhizonema sp. NSF051]|nr:hypothetical protein [Rhizonema sp. NSF051]